MASAVPWTVRWFLTVTAPAHTTTRRARHPLAAWMEPRTLLLGLFVFCMAFIEGTGNDWLGVAVIDGYDASPAVASLTLGIFLGAMTRALVRALRYLIASAGLRRCGSAASSRARGC